MGMLDAIAARFGYTRAAQSRPHRPRGHVRGFKAGESSRLTSSWKIDNGSINRILFQELEMLRFRSRELASNNEYAKQFIRLVKNNVVGPHGLMFRNRGVIRGTQEIDTDDNAAIQRHFARFSKRGNFDASGKLSRAMAESLYMETQVVDGEVLAVKKIDRRMPHGIAIKFLDVDRLDWRLNEARSPTTGRRIIMGVEVDDDYRAHYYHILRNHPGGQQYDPRREEHDTLPASRVIHGFQPMRPEQVRGVPWMYAAMLALWDLGGFREAAVINSRLGAHRLGFIKMDEGASEEDGLGTALDDAGERIRDSEPGEYFVLPSDADVQVPASEYPHPMFDSFNNAMLHGISAGFGVAHHSLSGNMQQVNFATGKIAQTNERDTWMFLQGDLAETFADSYFPDWLMLQLARGELLPMTQESFEAKNAASWRGRRWASVEPLKDAQANTLGIQDNTTHPRRIMENMGLDADEEWRIAAEDRELLMSLGLKGTAPAPVAPPTTDGDDDDGTDSDEPDDADTATPGDDDTGRALVARGRGNARTRAARRRKAHG